jgi:protein-L-isoaspartate O-methyltransferase
VTDVEQKERPGLVELGRYLREIGALGPEWEAAFAAVPRSAFLPEVMWPHDMETGQSTPVSRLEDPDGWQAAADSNAPIVTQWDDGAHEGIDPGGLSTSSASAPSVVFRMLADLDVRPGMRVLELGAGTGYNAGLLAHRVGVGNVVTVDVDPAVTDGARRALHGLGLPVTVVTGDGLAGYSPGAPFDRVIATFGLRQIPPAWVEQTRPGGIIVAPWGTHWSNRDAVVRLTVAEDGHSASGRFTRLVEFMKDRGQRLPRAEHAEYLPDGWPGDATAHQTQLPGEEFRPFGGFDFVAGLCVPDCHLVTGTRGEERSVWLYSLTDRSWAATLYRGDEPGTTVYQSGPRRLWDEVEAAYRWWEQQGRPGVERFGLTVHADGRQETWLDEPGQPVPTG